MSARRGFIETLSLEEDPTQERHESTCRDSKDEEEIRRLTVRVLHQ